MVEKLILILGDQLTEDLSSLNGIDPNKVVIVMAEVLGEASYVAHHPKKIILIFIGCLITANHVNSKFQEKLARMHAHLIHSIGIFFHGTETSLTATQG